MRPIFVLACVCVFAGGMAAAQSNVDSLYHHCWSTVGGWISWEDQSAPVDWGAQFYYNAPSPHPVQGYLWSESVGWIHLNPSGAGVTYTVSGTTASFSGYAWSTVAGWIDFDPAGPAQVTGDQSADPPELFGYAWSESLGWISLSGTSYGVKSEGPIPVYEWMLYAD